MKITKINLSEFEDLLNKLLEQKPGLTKYDIEEKIKQKKEKIGAGYLTDQGALFLIASELGIQLGESSKTTLGLKDLYVGAREVSVQTRLLNMSPPKQYSRKDGTPFFLRTMTVYDGNSTASVKLWNDKANIPGIDELKPGDLIRIIKAYVKSDLNGNPTINIGSGSTIEKNNEESQIPSIASITKDVSMVGENEKNIVVSGIIEGIINSMEFTTSRGDIRTAIRFRLRGNDGKSTRVVLWGKDEASIPKVISPDSKAKLLGVRTKTGNDGIEIHGNEATIIEVEGNKEPQPMVVRILNLSKSESGNIVMLGVDNKKNLYNITDSSIDSSSFQKDNIIEFVPSKAHGNSITIDKNSLTKKLDDDGNIPSLSTIRTKISDVKVGNQYCVEAIILKKPERREIQTKKGELISLSEMFVEDDTGQIWIKGWRNQSRMLDKFSIGEIISVCGVNARAGLEGRIELFLTPFSSIDKKN